jgi:hypothetical protein
MRKINTVRFLAAVALAGTASLSAVVAFGGVAAAKTSVTASCSGSFGNGTQGVEYGCTGSSSKYKGGAQAVTLVTSEGPPALITMDFTTGKTASASAAYTSTSDSGCPTELGVTATLAESETLTVTSNTAGLTDNLAGTAGIVCVWVSGSQIYEQSETAGSF